MDILPIQTGYSETRMFFSPHHKDPCLFFGVFCEFHFSIQQKNIAFLGWHPYSTHSFFKEFWVDIIVDSPFDYDRVDGFWGRKVDFLGFGNLFKDDKMRYCQMTAFLGIPSHSLGVK